jgi:MerR family transcriptional regulator, light-induced transcriptional regulator
MLDKTGNSGSAEKSAGGVRDSVSIGFYNSPPRRGPEARSGPEVGGIAERAISIVSRMHPISRRSAETAQVLALATAATRSDRELQCVVSGLIQTDHISPQTLVDCHIPAAARLLGEDWCGDNRSFVEVTIGSSRLQSLVRELSVHWHADRVRYSGSPVIALVVQNDEFHTLGAMVAASQFRRLGVSVQLILGRTDCAVAEALDRTAVDMIAISSSSPNRLDPVRNLIKVIRLRVAPLPPIVVGGAQIEDVNRTRAYTGADFCTSDPLEALRACALIQYESTAADMAPAR